METLQTQVRRLQVELAQLDAQIEALSQPNEPPDAADFRDANSLMAARRAHQARERDRLDALDAAQAIRPAIADKLSRMESEIAAAGKTADAAWEEIAALADEVEAGWNAFKAAIEKLRQRAYALDNSTGHRAIYGDSLILLRGYEPKKLEVRLLEDRHQVAILVESDHGHDGIEQLRRDRQVGRLRAIDGGGGDAA